MAIKESPGDGALRGLGANKMSRDVSQGVCIEEERLVQKNQMPR